MKTKPVSEIPESRLVAETVPWFEWLRVQGRSPETIRDYRYAITRLARHVGAHGLIALRDVQKSHLEEWQRQLHRSGLSPITIGGYLSPCCLLFRWLEARGEIFVSPCRGLELPKMPRRLLDVPSEAQMLRLLNSVTGETPVELRDRAILEVAYATGLRCRELVALDLDSIDWEEGVVRVIGKGEKERNGLLTKAAVLALRRYITSGRSMCRQSDGNSQALWLGPIRPERLARKALRAAVKNRAKAVGLTITPHAIRRAFATHLLRRGASPVELRRLLGHVSYKNLRHYLRYAPEDLRAAHHRSCLGQ